jgi:hypothetical protein
MNPNRDKRISLFQERFVKLYLRLNGYFTTGFIVQSENRGIETEVDIIAIRFPYNEQTEREVKNSGYLQIPPDAIDIVIGEAKMRTRTLQFNDPIRNDPNRDENWRKMLKWIGLFSEDEVHHLIPQLIDVIQTKNNHTLQEFPYVVHGGKFGTVILRPIFFAPDRRAPGRNQLRYVHGEEMVGFIWKCLNPEAQRKYCNTNYSVDVWGEYMDIVDYFKKRHKAKLEICAMDDLYEEFVPIIPSDNQPSHSPKDKI